MTEKTIVKFSADWCGPCKALQSVIDNSQFANVEWQFLDVDENRDSAIEMGIRSVPTLILFEDGEEKRRISGALNSSQLEIFVNGI